MRPTRAQQQQAMADELARTPAVDANGTPVERPVERPVDVQEATDDAQDDAPHVPRPVAAQGSGDRPVAPPPPAPGTREALAAQLAKLPQHGRP